MLILILIMSEHKDNDSKKETNNDLKKETNNELNIDDIYDIVVTDTIDQLSNASKKYRVVHKNAEVFVLNLNPEQIYQLYVPQTIDASPFNIQTQLQLLVGKGLLGQILPSAENVFLDTDKKDVAQVLVDNFSKEIIDRIKHCKTWTPQMYMYGYMHKECLKYTTCLWKVEMLETKLKANGMSEYEMNIENVIPYTPK